METTRKPYSEEEGLQEIIHKLHQIREKFGEAELGLRKDKNTGETLDAFNIFFAAVGELRQTEQLLDQLYFIFEKKASENSDLEICALNTRQIKKALPHSEGIPNEFMGAVAESLKPSIEGAHQYSQNFIGMIDEIMRLSKKWGMYIDESEDSLAKIPPIVEEKLDK